MTEQDTISGIDLECQHCDYNWHYSGHQVFWATCPRCLHKVKLSPTLGKEHLGTGKGVSATPLRAAASSLVQKQGEEL